MDKKDQLQTVVQEIAEELRDPARCPGHDRYSLPGGGAGIALFLASLARVTGDEGLGEAALAHLELAIDLAGEGEVGPQLYGGVSGVLWVAQQLRGGLLDGDSVDEVCEPFDEALVELLAEPTWEADYDLISGLVGYGVYLLERLPSATAREGLLHVLGHLERLAAPREVGLAWHTPPELLPPHQREVAPEGYDNLGLAHGAAGVIALLGRLCGAGVAPERARPLLEGALGWFRAQALPEGSRSRFSSWAAPGSEPEPSRLAWCYGDLGISLALLVAARGAGLPGVEREAVALGLAAAGRPFERAGVVDAGLCHGAAGNAHLFRRLLRETGEAAFGEAAERWLARALAMRRPGEAVAGFPSWSVVPWAPEETGWVADPGLLTGAAGVGLALLSSAWEVEPAWDRALLISG